MRTALLFGTVSFDHNCNKIFSTCFRDSLAFATEPVFGSLSNVFNKHENFTNGMPPHLKVFIYDDQYVGQFDTTSFHRFYSCFVFVCSVFFFFKVK